MVHTDFRLAAFMHYPILILKPRLPPRQVKSDLDASDFEVFRTLLTDFKKGATSTEALLDGVVPLFAAKRRWNLLTGFATIVKLADRPLLQRKIDAAKQRNDGLTKLGSAHGGATRDQGSQRSTGVDSSCGRSQGVEAPGHTAERQIDGHAAVGVRGVPGRIGAQPGDTHRQDTSSGAEVPKGRKCASCQRRPPEKAFKAACGHICCYACWLRVIEKTKMCPTCGGRVHKAALEKLYF